MIYLQVLLLCVLGFFSSPLLLKEGKNRDVINGIVFCLAIIVTLMFTAFRSGNVDTIAVTLSLFIMSIVAGIYLTMKGIIFPSIVADKKASLGKQIQDALDNFSGLQGVYDPVGSFKNTIEQKVVVGLLERLEEKNVSSTVFHNVIGSFCHFQNYPTISSGFIEYFTVENFYSGQEVNYVVTLTDNKHKLIVTENGNSIEMSINTDAFVHGIIKSTIDRFDLKIWGNSLSGDEIRKVFFEVVEKEYTTIVDSIVDEYSELFDFTKESAKSRERLIALLVSKRPNMSSLEKNNYDSFLSYTNIPAVEDYYRLFTVDLLFSNIDQATRVFETEPTSSNIGVPSLIRDELESCVFTLLENLPDPN